MRTIDLILDEAQTSAWFYDGHVWLMMGIGFISFTIAMLGLISIMDKTKIPRILAWVMFFAGAATFAFTPAVTNLISSTINPDSSNVLTDEEKIQGWAEDNYLVDLTVKDAQILNDGKINYDETKDGIHGEGSALGTYYGEKIVVTLIKEDKQWKLFSNDKELPVAVTEGVKK